MKTANQVGPVNRFALEPLYGIPPKTDWMLVLGYASSSRAFARAACLVLVGWFFWPTFAAAAQGDVLGLLTTVAFVFIVTSGTIGSYQRWLFQRWFRRTWTPVVRHISDTYVLQPFRVTSWDERSRIGTVTFSAIVDGVLQHFELPREQVRRVGRSVRTVLFLEVATDVTPNGTDPRNILRGKQTTAGFWVQSVMLGEFDT